MKDTYLEELVSIIERIVEIGYEQTGIKEYQDMFRHVPIINIVNLNECLKDININDIPLNDVKVFKMINENLVSETIFSKFLTKILKKVKVESIFDLATLNNFAHSTGAWNNNGELLFYQIPYTNLISCKEDIRDYLVLKGLDIDTAHEIMEIVRKGQVNNKLGGEYIKIMTVNNIDDWFIESCSKIKYLQARTSGLGEAIMQYYQIYLYNRKKY